MENENDTARDKRYTLATRDISLEALTVTGIFIALMIVWACLTDDKRFLFIPLLFLIISSVAFISLLFRYFTEPKIAIQADCNGIYFYYRNNREIFIDYKDILKVSSSRLRNRWGNIVITTAVNEYKSIRTKELNDKLLTDIRNLLHAEDKENYLKRFETEQKQV